MIAATATPKSAEVHPATFDTFKNAANGILAPEIIETCKKRMDQGYAVFFSIEKTFACVEIEPWTRQIFVLGLVGGKTAWFFPAILKLKQSGFRRIAFHAPDARLARALAKRFKLHRDLDTRMGNGYFLFQGDL